MTRAATGIDALDQMLGGGFMRSDVALVAGSAGTGKTILGLEFLINGITKFGENGIYVTFEELPDHLYRDALSFGWDLKKLEEQGRLKVICTSPNLLTAFGDGEGLLDDVIAKVKAKRIVIDSLSHLSLFVEQNEIRLEVYKLSMYLKRKGLTSLVTWEAPEVMGTSYRVSDVGVSFLVDCIVVLRYVEIESEMKKAVAVLKIRGSDHDKRLRELRISPRGIEIGAPFAGLEGVLTGSPRRSRTEAFTEAFRKGRGG